MDSTLVYTGKGLNSEEAAEANGRSMDWWCRGTLGRSEEGLRSAAWRAFLAARRRCFLDFAVWMERVERRDALVIIGWVGKGRRVKERIARKG